MQDIFVVFIKTLSSIHSFTDSPSDSRIEGIVCPLSLSCASNPLISTAFYNGLGPVQIEFLVLIRTISRRRISAVARGEQASLHYNSRMTEERETNDQPRDNEEEVGEGEVSTHSCLNFDTI